MRIVKNETLVKRESRLAKFGIYGSLAVLFGGLLVTLFGAQWGLVNESNILQFYIVYAGILLTGLVISRFGMHYGNRHLSPLRPELQLRENLKGLDRKYALMLFEQPHDYMLIEPGGVSAILFKNQPGLVTFKNGQWKHNQSVLARFLGRTEALGDPKREADTVLLAINKMLKEKLPDYNVPLRAIVVMGHPQVKLDVDPTPFAVIRPNQIKDYLRGAGKWKELPSSMQRAIREALGAPAMATPEGG